MNNSPRLLKVEPKFLGFLMLSYAMVMVLANWFDPRLVSLGGFVTDAGTLIFPLTFLLSDIITEVYGYRHARRTIWIGFLFNAIFILYGQIVIHLPGPSYAHQNKLFSELLGFDTRIIFASAISYLCSEPINSLLMAKLKLQFQGRYISLRFLSSTFFASGLDSCIFSLLAFYGQIPSHGLVSLILTMWIIKVSIELLGLPISIRLTKFFKIAEQVDMYDEQTQFNLFALEADYKADDNRYKEV